MFSQIDIDKNTFLGEKQVTIKNKENIIWKVYVSSSQLGQDNLDRAEKELIGFGKLMWSRLEKSSCFILRFLPSRDLVSKLSANTLSIL